MNQEENTNLDSNTRENQGCSDAFYEKNIFPLIKEGKNKFNWWVFFFGFFWFPYKGMWGRWAQWFVPYAILLPITEAIAPSLLMGAFAYNVSMGFVANKQYYKFYSQKKSVKKNNILRGIGGIFSYFLILSIATQVIEGTSEEEVISKCNSIINYFDKNNLFYQEGEINPKTPSMFKLLEFNIPGDGFIKKRPVIFTCVKKNSRNPNSTGLYVYDTILNKNKIALAKKNISKILFFDIIEEPHREELISFYNEATSDLRADSFTSWIEKKSGLYTLRLMTVQVDMARNFALIINLVWRDGD